MTTSIANSTPIYAQYPGWVQGGNAAGIELEFFIDFLCYDSMMNYPEVDAALNADSPVAGSTWMDLMSVKVSNFPLDYHMHSWPVAQVLPFLQDKCAEGSYCLQNEFMAWCFDNQNTVLGMTDVSHDHFVANEWPQMVSDAFD